MTIDVPTAGIATGAAAVLWFLLRLTVFDAIKELRASNIRQGTRIGKLEEWRKAHDAVEEFRHRRKLTSPRGVPVQEDETPA
jgi:hypothetical protein